MEKFKYVIVDDEYPIHLPIQHHLKGYPHYKCDGVFFNPKKALAYLQKKEIDLIFLDIEMPEMNGFKFLEALTKNIFVVILTAYQEKYSLEAHLYYDKDLVFFSNKAQFFYYLPAILTRFEKMYGEKKLLERVNQLSKNEIQTFPRMINNKKIPLVDIVHIKVFGHNIVLKMANNEELVFRMSIREVANILPPNLFLQISRSIVVGIGHITSFTNSTVFIDNKHITISNRNRKEVVRILEKQKELLSQNY